MLCDYYDNSITDDDCHIRENVVSVDENSCSLVMLKERETNTIEAT